MSYFDLLRTRKYFDIFLKSYNDEYGKGDQKSGKEKETNYCNLIKRHYMIDQGGIGNPRVYSDPHVYRNHVAHLISNRTHIDEAHESLRNDLTP